MLVRGLNLLRNNYSSEYAKAMYEAWKKNPKDVHEDWNVVFNSTPSEGSSGSVSEAQLSKEKGLALNAYMLIRYYKNRGH